MKYLRNRIGTEPIEGSAAFARGVTVQPPNACITSVGSAFDGTVGLSDAAAGPLHPGEGTA